MIQRNYRLLRLKLLVAILGFSLIPVMGLGYVLFLQFNDAYEERSISNLRTIVDNKRYASDLFLKEKVTFLRTIAYENTFDGITEPGSLRKLYSSIEGGTRDFIDIGVISSSGKHVSYVGPYNISYLDYSQEPWFSEVMFRGVYISDVFLGFRNYPHFIIAVLRREDDKSWILRATVDLDVFKSLVQTVQTGRRGDAFLLNKENILQTPSRFAMPILSKCEDIETPPSFQGVLVEKQNVRGEPRLVGMSWLTMVNWMLVVTEDHREVMNPMIQAEQNAFLVFLSGAFLVCIGSVFVSRKMVQKIMEADKEAALLDASLLQSNKMAALGKLAAGVAHEVNNPLTLIRESAGWISDLLSEENPETMHNYKEISKLVDNIDRHVERARDVTHRMLGFGRRMDPMQENVNLNNVLAETVKFMESEALHRNIEIVLELDPMLPLITTDPNQLQQVFLNIIDNSIDAMENSGTLTLKTGLVPDRKEIFISLGDNGCGIPKEQLAHIFDPFYTTKQVGGGTGLGLAIVFGIVEKLNGRIAVESTVGQGTTFTITFPLA